MNEQLQSALTQIIEKAISGIDTSVNFLSAELPDVISQLLLWYGVSNAVYGLFGLLLIYGCYLIAKPPKGRDNWAWDFDGFKHEISTEGVFLVLLVFPIAIGLAMAFCIMESLQILIAPKIWLIEYASNLVK